MRTLTHNLKELGWRRLAFSLVVLAYLGFLGFINVMMFLPGNRISAMGHFSFARTGETHDLIHEFVFSFIIGTAAVGLLSQLWKPKESASWRIAGQLVALIAWVMMVMIAALTGNWVPQPLFYIFGGLTILATILHPAGAALLNWIGTTKVNRILLTLVIVAAIPLLAIAFTNIKLQLADGGAAGFFNHNPSAFHGGAPQQESAQDQSIHGADGVTMDDEAVHDQKHSNLGHYRNFAVLSFIIILAGLLASLMPRGWRVAARIAGGLPTALGLASVVLPSAESSLGVMWGFVAIVWGVTFITAAEFSRPRNV